MVKSKYSFRTYAGLFAGFAFLIAVSWFSTTVDLWENAKKLAVPIPTIVLLLLLLFLTLLMLYRIFKTTPDFHIDQNCIRISGLFRKKREIQRNDISEINLFAAGLVAGWLTIVTKIELISGEKIRLADPNYRNTGKLKQALVEYFPEKISSYKAKPGLSLTGSSSNAEVQKFSGNPFINFNSLIFAAFIVFVILLSFLPNKVNDMKWVTLFFFALLYFFTGSQMHYFLIDAQCIVVKNHYFFWLEKKYSIENIIAADIEQSGKLSRSLRITTKDFRSKNYSAGSLRGKTWNALRQKIEELGIYFIP